MQTFKLPRSSGNYALQLAQLRRQINAKLSKFCTDKVLETGWVPKSFAYEFDLVGNRSGGQRKSIQRLRDIIQKNIKKRIPYMEYILDGDLIKNSNQGANVQLLEMKSPWMTYTLEPNDRMRSITRNQRWVKSIERYVRLLNYKCIRNGIPLKITNVGFTEDLRQEEREKLETWMGKSDGTTFTFKARVRFAARVQLVAHFYPTFTEGYYDDVRELETYEQFENWLETNTLAPEEKLQLRSAYYSVDQWHHNSLDTYLYSGVQYRGSEKYICPEKIFTELESLQKVLKTLSRKASYDVAAFNIGSGEAS